MIFKYCAWSNETKEDNNKLDNVKKSDKENNLAGTVLRCCPCVFRCRRSIGIGNDNDDQSDSTIISNTDVTPVIAVRLHRSTDTIDKAPVNEEESNDITNNYYSSETNVYPDQILKNENGSHEGSDQYFAGQVWETIEYRNFYDCKYNSDHSYDLQDAKSRSPGSTSSEVSVNDRNAGRERSIAEDLDAEGSDSNGNDVSRDDNQKAFDVISRKSEERDIVDSRTLPTKESESSGSVESASTLDDTSKDSSSEDGLKERNDVVVSSEQEELLRDDDTVNATIGSSDEIVDVTHKNIDKRRRSTVSIISNERTINVILASSNESTRTDYKNVENNYEDVTTVSPSSKHRAHTSPIKFDSDGSRVMNTNDSNLDLFGSPRSDLQSPRLSMTFDDHINEILNDVNDDDLLPATFHKETAIFQTLDKEKPDKINHLLDSPSDYLEKIDNIESIEEIVESRINEDVNVVSDVSVENINTYDTMEGRTTNVAFTKISNSKSFTKLDDIGNDIEHEETLTILNIEPQPIESAEQSIKRITSKVPRSTNRSRNMLHTKASQHSEKTGDKCKPIVQQCFNQLESKDWEITMKGLKTLSQLAEQHPEYLDINIGGTVGRLLGRHIRSLRSQVARAACIAAGDIFTSQIRGIDQDIDDIAGPLLHRTADTNRFLRADSNAALDRMVESLPPHKIIGIIVHRGANHQNAIVRGATARLLSSIVDRIGAEHAMILPREVRDKLIGSGAKLLMDGNLDARNHAKKMFRHLAHCEGFRKALTDTVPETTLRHIDKTLKSL